MHYAGGPVVRWPQGPIASKGQHLLWIKGLSSLKGALAGDRVLIGAPNISKSSIPCRMLRMYAKKIATLHIRRQEWAALSLSGAFIDVTRLFRNGCITPGGPSYCGIRSPMTSKGAHSALDHGPQLVQEGPGWGLGLHWGS